MTASPCWRLPSHPLEEKGCRFFAAVSIRRGNQFLSFRRCQHAKYVIENRSYNGFIQQKKKSDKSAYPMLS
jgi:hypothetical protein